MGRARKLFPDQGLPYRLFDSSVLLALLSYFWYVGSPPSAVTLETVGDVYAALLSPRGWGIGLMVAGALGVACAYVSRFWWRGLLVGYLTLIAATGGWSAALLAGVILGDPSRDLGLKALGSCLLFAWICRGLLSAVMQAEDARAIGDDAR